MSNEQYLGTDSVGNKYFGSWYEDENDRGWNVRIERYVVFHPFCAFPSAPRQL